MAEADSAARDEPFILVVEDDQDVREGVSELLTEEGYAVETVPDGEKALDRLARRPLPCLVLLDMRMPGRSGWQVLELAQRSPELGCVKFAAFTADNRATPEGVVAILRKPFPVEDLLDLVSKHCPSSLHS